MRLPLLVTAGCMLLSSCGKQSGDVPGPRALSPRDIHLPGIAFYMTPEEVSGRLAGLRCEAPEKTIRVCTWSPDTRQDSFRGVSQLRLVFYRDSLHMISVRYAEMVDAEYVNFARAVREKYAPALQAADSAGAQWIFDSVSVSLTPNRRRHWTGSIDTYAPVLEFQERVLYRRWLQEVSGQKPKEVY